MLPRLLKLATMLSLLLFALSVCIWVRSWMGEEDIVLWSSQLHPRALAEPPETLEVNYGIAWARGTVELYRLSGRFSGTPAPSSGWWYKSGIPPRNLVVPPSSADRLNLALGPFQLRCSAHSRPFGWTGAHTLVLPLWLFLPAAIPPVLWWRRHRQRFVPGFPVVGASSSRTEQ